MNKKREEPEKEYAEGTTKLEQYQREDSGWRTVSSIASRETISDKINRLIRRELDAFFTLCP